MSERFVARNNAARLLLMAAASLGFVAAGLWIAGVFGPPPRPGREWIGWVAILFFGAAGVAILRRAVDGGELIVVDRHGIFWRPQGDAPIPWTAIRALGTGTVRRQRFICLHLHDPDAWPPRRRNPLGALNRGLGFGDIAISATGTDRSFADLQEAVDRHAAAAGLVRTG